MLLLSLLFPMKAAIRVGPGDLQHRERGPPVEPDGPPEEGPVPAEIDLPERDLLTIDNVRLTLAVSQDSVGGGLRPESVEHAVRGVNIESEQGEFRCPVSVCAADRVSETRTDLVLGNHYDVPSMLLHILDDRQIHAVRFVPVTVFMAEDAAALERITSHVQRLRGKRLIRTAGFRTKPSSSVTAPQDLCQNRVWAALFTTSDSTVPWHCSIGRRGLGTTPSVRDGRCGGRCRVGRRRCGGSGGAGWWRCPCRWPRRWCPRWRRWSPVVPGRGECAGCGAIAVVWCR